MCIYILRHWSDVIQGELNELNQSSQPFQASRLLRLLNYLGVFANRD